MDDRDAVQDAEDDEAEEEGEDLFGANLNEYATLTRSHRLLTLFLNSDYAANELLDKYSDAGLNDDDDVDDISPEARRAAEQKMARRDRQERTGKRGARAARRSRAPAFLGSDDDLDEDEDIDGGLGVSRMKQRTRRAYDERRDIDDLDGIEDVCCILFLSIVQEPTSFL